MLGAILHNLFEFIAQTLSNHHLGKVTGNVHTQLGRANIGAAYSIVYEVCGEPESVGEDCAFSFIRCWCSLAKTRKAILQNNILIQKVL